MNLLRRESKKPLRYSVWVGGTEVNDHELTYDEAVAIKHQYVDEGYDDVKMQLQPYEYKTYEDMWNCPKCSCRNDKRYAECGNCNYSSMFRKLSANLSKMFRRR